MRPLMSAFGQKRTFSDKQLTVRVAPALKAQTVVLVVGSA